MSTAGSLMVHSDKEESPNFVTALARGLSVIQAFTPESPEMTLSEIAARTGISPASVRRSLFTLEALGYVALNGRRYVLRSQVLTLGAAYFESMHLKDVAIPPLNAIARQFKDAVSMAVLDETDVIYIVHIPSDRSVRFRASLGYRLPIYATSLGRVLMAFEDQGRVDKYLKLAPFPEFTSKTIVDAKKLRRLFERARSDRFATAEAQLEYGVIAVAVPVFAPTGRAVAAINCSSESARGTLAELVQSRLPALRDAARQVEIALERQPFLVHSVWSRVTG